jgi:hypothetical protein
MSVKVLLDECLPKKLKYRIEELDPDFIVHTVPEINWDSLPDGKLLSKAENEFNVFITSDRNLSFQQSIPDTQIHVLLLIASTNIYEDLLPLIEKLTPVLKANKPGQFTQIE